MKKKIVLSVFAALAFCISGEPKRGMSAADGIEGMDEGVWNPTAADYIQDGLIAQWDGIENAGWGVNDKTVDYWEELISGTRVIKTKVGVREWSDSGDSLEVPPVDVYPSPEVHRILSQDIVSRVKCYEVVGYRTKEDDIICSLLYNCSANYKVFSYNIAANSPVHRRFYLCGSVKEDLSYEKDLFRSSEFVTGKNNTGATSANNLRVFGGRIQRAYGGICAIRFYDRELSEAEIAYNYLIDRIRYDF